MNNKILSLCLAVLVIAIVLVPFASAFSWQDFMKMLNIGGRATAGINKTCTDSDNGLDFNAKGIVERCSLKSCNKYSDRCSGTSGNVIERYCNKTNVATQVYKCANGCYDGACIIIPEPSNETDLTQPQASNPIRVIISYTSQLWPASSWSQSMLSSFYADRVNDGINSLGAFHTDTSPFGSYLALDTGAGNEKEFARVDITFYFEPVYAVWDVQYSDDNANWSPAKTDIGSYPVKYGGTYTYTWEIKGKHRYWRLFRTSDAKAGGYHSEIQFYEAVIKQQPSNTTKYSLNCTKLYYGDWHVSKECDPGFCRKDAFAGCDYSSKSKKYREVCQKTYTTQCLDAPKCPSGYKDAGKAGC